MHINAHHQLKAVYGLLAGMQESEASHLDLLTAFLPAEQIKDAYTEAQKHRSTEAQKQSKDNISGMSLAI